MNNIFRKVICALAVIAPSLAFAQGPSVAMEGFNAYHFAYGNNSYRIGNTSGATVISPPAPLRVDIGTTATGAGTLTLAYGTIKTVDGYTVMPLATNAKINVGSGANLEAVTPSAVSCTTPSVYATCTITATFANIHGRGDLVASASGGLSEAVNFAGSLGGGAVWIDRAWISLGLTVAYVTGTATGYSTVPIVQNIGTSSASHSYSYAATGTYPTASAYVITTVAWY